MTQTGTVALPSDYETGLEDFDPTDAALPRISIVHEAGTFKDNLSGEEFAEIDGVFLGMIKQRVLWAEDVEDDAKPLCKSSDAETGFPNVTGPEHSLFPWVESGFSLSAAEKDEYDRPTLNCETCPFTQWGKKGTKSVPPRCSERYTFPIRYRSEPDGALDRSGILSLQRSGITPAKSYLSIFSRGKMPMFSAYTRLKLDRKSRGTVKYSTPVFARGGPVPPEEWEDHAKEYRAIREFLREPPRADDDGSDSAQAKTAGGNSTTVSSGSTVATAPAAPATPAAAAPLRGGLIGGTVIDAVSTVTSSVAAENDDLPF